MDALMDARMDALVDGRTHRRFDIHQRRQVPAIREAVEREYPGRSGGLHATVLECTPSQGAHRLA